MTPEQAAAAWGLQTTADDSPDQGLINKTYVVGNPPQYILQWVNPIFSPLIHNDLIPIIAHARNKGVTLPKLITLPDQSPCLIDRDSGCWRLWEYIPGTTIHKLTNPKTAAAAGKLVAEFHNALFDLKHDFIAPQRDVHNTPERMKDLQHALNKSEGHPLAQQASDLGERILFAWSQWDGVLDLPQRICHGDLKISNLRFADDRESGICLLDLDTIGPQTIAAEMGDAWRSWCNPAREDQPEKVRFDLSIFEASATSYLSSAPAISLDERRSLVSGIIRICLELSARFCADALQNSYFKEDRNRFPTPGQHNLLKAQSQFRLAQAVINHRQEAERIIEKA